MNRCTGNNKPLSSTQLSLLVWLKFLLLSKSESKVHWPKIPSPLHEDLFVLSICLDIYFLYLLNLPQVNSIVKTISQKYILLVGCGITCLYPRIIKNSTINSQNSPLKECQNCLKLLFSSLLSPILEIQYNVWSLSSQFETLHHLLNIVKSQDWLLSVYFCLYSFVQ